MHLEGLSLDELGARANLSPLTISLDVLVPLAQALQVDLDTLLDASAPAERGLWWSGTQAAFIRPGATGRREREVADE